MLEGKEEEIGSKSKRSLRKKKGKSTRNFYEENFLKEIFDLQFFL